MSKKDIYMPEHLIRDEEGNITKREDVTLVTEDYSVKTQGTTLDKKLTEITDKIDVKWGKDELELGGRNYLTQKDQEKIARYNDFITTESKQENGLYVHEIVALTDVTVRAAIPVYDYKNFKEDDDITVSCDIKSTEELLVKLTQTTEDEYKIVKPNEWVRVYSKVDYGDRIGIYTENQAREGAVINVKNYKLEKGNIATPFSLAPEDEDEIATQTSPLANLDHIDKIDKQVVENTKMKWGKEELEIGGRNLALNSKDFSRSKLIILEDTSVNSDKINDSYHITSTGGRGLLKFYVRYLEVESLYKDLNNQLMLTNSIKLAQVNHDMEIVFNWSSDFANRSILIPEGFSGIVSHTALTSNSNCQVNFRTKNIDDELDFKIEWMKIEEGHIATDWTPAPEDIGGIQTQPAPLANMAHIEYLENQIKELREMIALRGLSR